MLRFIQNGWNILRALLFLFLLMACSSGEEINDQIVEASCGQCQFKMEGNGCNLAIRIDSTSYWVDGTGIDDHGDAHASDGFCEAIRKAKVTGKIIDGRFKAESFELIKEE